MLNFADFKRGAFSTEENRMLPGLSSTLHCKMMRIISDYWLSSGALRYVFEVGFALSIICVNSDVLHDLQKIKLDSIDGNDFASLNGFCWLHLMS